MTAEDVIRRLPESNPAVVLRVSDMGTLLYGNPASADAQFLGLEPGDTLPSRIYGGIVDSADHPGMKGVRSKPCSGHIPNGGVGARVLPFVYGTDITAMKALAFSGHEPQPCSAH